MSALTLEMMLRQIVRDAVAEAMQNAISSSNLNAVPIRNGNEPFLSVAKAARIADVAPGTIRTWIRKGRLTAQRAGRVLRVSRSELDRFMSGSPDSAQQAETARRAREIFKAADRRLQHAA